MRLTDYVDPRNEGKTIAALIERGLLCRSAETGRYAVTESAMPVIEAYRSGARSAGRPRVHGSNAEKQAEYRRRKLLAENPPSDKKGV